jgi:hypothetical protein
MVDAFDRYSCSSFLGGNPVHSATGKDRIAFEKRALHKRANCVMEMIFTKHRHLTAHGIAGVPEIDETGRRFIEPSISKLVEKEIWCVAVSSSPSMFAMW